MTSYERDLKIQSLKMYYNGMRDGITDFAHWKDGVQYVGTCGKTLSEAIKAINRQEESRIAEYPVNDN